tara:strand:- start:28 stop:465 length:438 start_codon:yes stop_codon:yes gene_type:complete
MIETAILCLALNIYFEARDQPIEGQIAVAEVTLNRVNSYNYPNTVCEVVFQSNKTSCAFSWWCDGKSDTPKDKHAFETSKIIAKLMIEDGEYIDVLGNKATHYHNEKISPYWAKHLTQIKRIGQHVFYEQRKKTETLPRPDNLNK